MGDREEVFDGPRLVGVGSITIDNRGGGGLVQEGGSSRGEGREGGGWGRQTLFYRGPKFRLGKGLSFS